MCNKEITNPALHAESLSKFFPINEHCKTLVSYIYKKLRIMKIFVAGLPYDLDDAELEEIFEKFGTVSSAKVAMDKETGKSKGFGFVDMPVAAEAKDAIESLNDISLGKKPLVVKEAEERSTGGGGGGFAPRKPSFNSRPGGGFNSNRPSGGGGYNKDRNRY